MKLIVSMFDKLFGLIAPQKQDKKGSILDADLKVKPERHRIQMKKVKEGIYIFYQLMSLAPLAILFFSYISPSKLSKHNQFLCRVRDSCSHLHSNLFCKILEE